MPLWPNGEGIGLLSQGLWVQVPPGAILIFINSYCYKRIAINIFRMYINLLCRYVRDLFKDTYQILHAFQIYMDIQTYTYTERMYWYMHINVSNTHNHVRTYICTYAHTYVDKKDFLSIFNFLYDCAYCGIIVTGSAKTLHSHTSDLTSLTSHNFKPTNDIVLDVCERRVFAEPVTIIGECYGVHTHMYWYMCSFVYKYKSLWAVKGAWNLGSMIIQITQQHLKLRNCIHCRKLLHINKSSA